MLDAPMHFSFATTIAEVAATTTVDGKKA